MPMQCCGNSSPARNHLQSARRRALRAGVMSGALDEQGKAILGCPGPGAYDSPSLFNLDAKCVPESRAGKHVFHFDGAYTLKGRSKVAEWAADSPGPALHTPHFEAVDAGVKPARFGHADRATEAKRYISHSLATTDTGATPGPGAYRYRTGKGCARTIGDAPVTVIGTGERPPINAAADPDVPGAKYDVPGALDARPGRGFSIAPLNSRERGLARDRVTEAREYIKQYTGPGTGPPAGSAAGPSPLAYDPNVLAASGAHSRSPVVAFGKAPLNAADKVTPAPSVLHARFCAPATSRLNQYGPL